MPHDLKGNPIQAGDVVIAKFTVLSVTNSEEACNCTVQTLEPMFGTDNYSPVVTLNTKQVEKA